MRKIIVSSLTTLVLAISLCAAPNRASAATDDAKTRCEALQAEDLTGIPDAPAKILKATYSDDGAELFQDFLRFAQQWESPEQAQAVMAQRKRTTLGHIGPFCHVSGYALTNVGFEMLLPVEHWNGKFLHMGCGGYCGSTVLHGESIMSCARHGDYACIATDMGHSSSIDFLWARNNLQAQADFGHRATHLTALVGKVLIERYYARKPQFSYFTGCSTGGYQAMMEAQAYPGDFNGILAGAPDMDESDLALRNIWIGNNFLDSQRKPRLNEADIALLHQAALSRCDRDDGLQDGIIGNPLHCAFDPAEIQCKGVKDNQCLDAAQVQAARNIYGQPKNSKGETLSTRGALPGSELYWTKYYEKGGEMEAFFRESGLLNGPVDFDRDPERVGVGVLYANTNPDLRRFKARGGKLISYQGYNDADEVPGAVFDYYETVEKTMGGRAHTQDFFRLFGIPGMGHCSGGTGADATDFLGSLVAWVERGEAPDRILSGHLKDIPPTEAYPFGKNYPYRMLPSDSSLLSFTRPLYPYPLYAKYKGTGDPNKAENFVPTMPR